jgi:hypothetical protein
MFSRDVARTRCTARAPKRGPDEGGGGGVALPLLRPLHTHVISVRGWVRWLLALCCSQVPHHDGQAAAPGGRATPRGADPR